MSPGRLSPDKGAAAPALSPGAQAAEGQSSTVSVAALSCSHTRGRLRSAALLGDNIPFRSPAFRPSPPEQPQGWGSPRGKLAAAKTDTVWSVEALGPSAMAQPRAGLEPRGAELRGSSRRAGGWRAGEGRTQLGHSVVCRGAEEGTPLLSTDL